MGWEKINFLPSIERFFANEPGASAGYSNIEQLRFDQVVVYRITTISCFFHRTRLAISLRPHTASSDVSLELTYRSSHLTNSSAKSPSIAETKRSLIR
jgi:hypothetical protein